MRALFRLLWAVLPLLVAQQAIQLNVLLPMAVSGSPDLLMLSSASPRIALERARPEQGGKRISYAWLKTLRGRACLYRFR
jgi:hypothetical protein